MKKISAIFLFILTIFSMYPAHAEVAGKNPKLLVDSLTPEQIQDLNIVVPPETDPGFQVLTIQVYDNNGVQSERFVYFCKDLKGIIHWDNKCPDLEPLATQDELKKTLNLDSLPKYDPAQESKKSAGIIAAAVGFLLLLTGGGQKFIDSASATFVSLAADKKSGGAPIKRWGDRSFTWRFPGYRFTDELFKNLSFWLSKRSLILARILGDGDYGRAMFGLLWNSLIIAAPLLGYHAAQDVKFFYSPPAIELVIAMMALGIFDAFAGFIASWTFVIAILIKNPPADINHVLMLIAVALLSYAPVLIAAAARTFRRITNNTLERWEKTVDYFLAPVIGMWAVIKLVEGLNGFIGRQFLLTFYAVPLGILAGALLLLRMFMEEFANRVYTWRIDAVATEYAPQKKTWHFLGFLVEIAIATYFAFKFSDWNIYLAYAIGLGFFPKLLSILLGKKIPKSRWVHYLTPKSIFLTVILVYSASYYESFIRNQFRNAQEFLIWWIVLSAIPAFIFAMVNLFANTSGGLPLKQRPLAKYFWRIGSIIIYFALLLLIFQVPPDTVIDLIRRYQWKFDLNSISEFLGISS